MLLWVEECQTINKRKYDLCDVNHMLGFNVMSKQLHIVCILYPGLLGNFHCCDSLNHVNQFHYSFGYNTTVCIIPCTLRHFVSISLDEWKSTIYSYIM